MSKIFQFGFSLFVSVCLFWVNNLSSDTLELKSGQVYENVKVNIKHNAVEFTNKGKRISLEKSKIKRIKLKPVKVETKEEVKEKTKEESKIETATLENQDTEQILNDPEATDKTPILLLRFTREKGITEEELANVVGRVKSELSNLGLFEIREDSENSQDCPKEKVDCQNPATNNARIIVSSVLSKSGKYYFINGNVLDTKNDIVDFTEASIAKSVDELDATALDYSKKLIDILTGNIKQKTKSDDSHYIWKSALFPGFGQYRFGADKDKSYSLWKGIGFASIFFLASIDTYSSYNNLKKEESNYKNFHNLFYLYPTGSLSEQILFIEDGQRSIALQNSSQYVMSKIYFLCFVYLVNIVDIFFPQNYFLGLGSSKGINEAFLKNIGTNPESENKSESNASFLIAPEKNHSRLSEGLSANPYFLFSYRWRF